MSNLFIERYAPGSYGGMSQRDDGGYVRYDDVVDMLEEVLGHDKTVAIIHEYFDVPEAA